MSQRNDSILLTGMNSGTVSKVDRERQKRLKKEKQESLSKRSVVAPAIEPILFELEKEKKRTILELLESVDVDTHGDDIKASLVALNKYKASMDRLGNKFKAIMRVEVKDAE